MDVENRCGFKGQGWEFPLGASLGETVSRIMHVLGCEIFFSTKKI